MLHNPVLWKEIKTKMRSRQPRAVQVTIASLVGLFVLWCYYQAINWLMHWGGANGGRDAWQAAVVLQAILVWGLSPALAANAVTQEKEQQTWEMLIFTLLTPGEILTGKLVSRLIPMAVLLGVFFPFMLFCYVMSTRISPMAFFGVYFNFAVWTLFLVTVSLFTSWAFRRTATAIAVSYLVLFVLTIGTALLHTTLTYAQSSADSALLWLNPVRITYALIETENDPSAAWVLAFSLTVFAGITGFLFWRMVRRFRAFSIE